MIFGWRYVLTTLLIVTIIVGSSGVVIGAQADSRAELNRQLVELNTELSVDSIDTDQQPTTAVGAEPFIQEPTAISEFLEEINPFSEEYQAAATATRDVVVSVVFQYSKAIVGATALVGFGLSRFLPTAGVVYGIQIVSLLSVVGVVLYQLRRVLAVLSETVE